MQELVVRGDDFACLPFQASDLELLVKLHKNPKANRFLCSEETSWSAEQTAAWLDKTLADREKHGFSAFKLLVDQTGEGLSEDTAELAGWVGFVPLEETSEISLQHCLKPELHDARPGLLQEAAGELMEWFFERTYFSHVVACVRTDDREGRALAQGLNFSYRESRRMLNMPCDVFQRFSPSMQALVANA